MKKKKYYAVYQGLGRTPDIVGDWDTCLKKVHRAPGAQYKSFKEKESAITYLAALEGVSVEVLLTRYDYLAEGIDAEKLSSQPDVIYNQPSQTEVSLYVDGSFQEGVDAYGYGWVIVKDGQQLEAFAGYGDKEEAVKLRNVAGEMLGAVEGIKKIFDMGFKSVSLYFDYQGIESWARGTWKRNNVHTKAYYQFMDKAQRQLSVEFVKVTAHSGDKWNDVADALAKEGVEKARHDKH